MQKQWLWWVSVIIFGVAFFFFTASPLSNNEYTLLVLKKFNFLSVQDIIWLSKIVRKAAHFLAYAILAISLRNAMYPHPWAYPAAWLLAALYGGGDEFHQAYVPGRTSLFTDVIIDSLGAALGLLIIYWKHRISMTKQEKREQISR